jgi:glycosyltransferase involved in cell wall biosynthesis
MRMSGISGSENHLAELVPELARAGWAVDVLVPSPSPGALDDFVARLEGSARSVDVLGMRADASPALAAELRRRMSSGAYGIVHTHLVHADWHAALAKWTVRSPSALVSTKHNHDPFRERRPVRVMERLTAREFDRVIAISDSLRGFVVETSAVRADTVRYGLQPPPVPSVERAPRDLLAVGRLEPQKGVDVVLRAMREVVGRFPDVRLRVAGDGGQRETLGALTSELGLDRHVEFLGQRTDVVRLMAQAGLLVHGARWEGFGLVLLEAMAAATPIVATAVGGIVEVVDDRTTGVLVPPDDPDTLAATIIALLEDPQRASAMGAAGRRRLEERFSPERMGRETVEIYEQLVAP